MFRFWQILILTVFVIACEARRSNVSVEKKFSRNFVQFEDFRRKFDKNYSSAKEALERFHVFAKNLEKIDMLNRMEEGTATYGVNEMADWTEEEFLTRRANLNPVKLMESLESAKEVSLEDIKGTAPETKDWRSEGKVAPVKQQGQCGSCWAFSTTGVVESVNAIKTGKLTTMSEQQLVDCDPKSSGCNGGWPDYAIDYLKDTGGQMTAASYPYTGKDGNCKFSSGNVAAKVIERTNVPARNERAMKEYVGLVSPTSNAINANMLQFYKRGIMKPNMVMCSPRGLNHAVLVVGYGKDFWIIKNSWGTGWGENGFARIQKGSNTCGIAEAISAVKIA